MMESSTLKVEFRRADYYRKFKYRAVVDGPGMSFVKNATSPADVVTKIDENRAYRQKRQTSYGYGWGAYGKHNKEYWNGINYPELKNLWSWVNDHKNECRFRYEGDKLGIFSNDLPLLKTLEKLVPVVKFSQSKSVEGKMFFAEKPEFEYRVYFKSGGVKADFIETLADFILRNVDNKNMRFSDELKAQALNGKFLHTWAYFHCSHCIDFTNEKNLTLLHMLFGGMLGKFYKLEKRPE